MDSGIIATLVTTDAGVTGILVSRLECLILSTECCKYETPANSYSSGALSWHEFYEIGQIES